MIICGRGFWTSLDGSRSFRRCISFTASMVRAEMTTTAERLRILSEWIDNAPANQVRDAEAATWGRLSKVAEEAGEVIAAFIGVTNQNPRKGIYATREDVIKELLDTAVTALCAVEHMIGNRGDALPMLFAHINFLEKRAGLEEVPDYDW